RTRPIAELKAGDRIYGTRADGAHRQYVPSRVLAHWSVVKAAYRLTLANGTQLIASADHRFFSDRGWVFVIGPDRPHLSTGLQLMGPGNARERALAGERV